MELENKKMKENSEESLTSPNNTNGIYGQTPASPEISIHDRQKSTLHSEIYSPTKGGRIPPPSDESLRMYPGAPDLPPRIDRAVKPGVLSKSGGNVTSPGRSAHERLFGSKQPSANQDHDGNGLDNNFKGSPVERRGENSKLVR